MGELEPAKTRWISDVSNADVLRFGIWLALVAAISVASTAAIISEAEARTPRELTNHYLARWGALSGGSLVLLALLGGLLVFGRATRFEIAGTWPAVAGVVVGACYYVTLSAMGQTEAGSVGCDGPQECDTSLGLGAGFLMVLAAIVIDVLFVSAYGLKRLVLRPARSQS